MKILKTFTIVYIILAVVIYFGLKAYVGKSFSTGKLTQMIDGKSLLRDTTTDLCKYQILGDPKEIGNYVKINIACKNGKKASSTITLSAVEDKSINGVRKEYARIIGFDIAILDNKFDCTIDGLPLTEEMLNTPIQPKSSLNCNEK